MESYIWDVGKFIIRVLGYRDYMVVGFTTTYTISAHHHKNCEFESCSWQDVLNTTLCDQVCQRLATGQWFS
jgi:gentisate 1,2-dioxygenase